MPQTTRLPATYATRVLRRLFVAVAVVLSSSDGKTFRRTQKRELRGIGIGSNGGGGGGGFKEQILSGQKGFEFWVASSSLSSSSGSGSIPRAKCNSRRCAFQVAATSNLPLLTTRFLVTFHCFLGGRHNLLAPAVAAPFAWLLFTRLLCVPTYK